VEAQQVTGELGDEEGLGDDDPRQSRSGDSHT
jgi:hypothetical protein